MANFQIFKETALPSTLQPNSIYLVTSATNSSLVEMFVTNVAGTAARHVLSESDVQTMISNSITSSNSAIVVANIAARDALLPLTATKWVYVIDATGDATVASGGATYLYNTTTSAWVKVSEAESLDLVLNWTTLTGKPTSAVADIDDAVSKRHTHTNMTQLNKIGEDVGGNLTYNGSLVSTGWTSTNW